MEFAARGRSTSAVDGVGDRDGRRFSDPPPPNGTKLPLPTKSFFCTDVLKALLSKKKKTSPLCDLCGDSDFSSVQSRDRRHINFVTIFLV
jgi:hypothetical protein